MEVKIIMDTTTWILVLLTKLQMTSGLEDVSDAVKLSKKTLNCAYQIKGILKDEKSIRKLKKNKI
jgi:hypothetical protein